MRIILAALGLLLCAHPTGANAQGADGKWTGTAYVIKSPGCGADGILEAEMKGDQMQGRAQFPGGSPKFEWSVASGGDVRGEGMEGRIADNKLTGSWQRVGRGGQCTYRIEMTPP